MLKLGTVSTITMSAGTVLAILMGYQEFHVWVVLYNLETREQYLHTAVSEM